VDAPAIDLIIFDMAGTVVNDNGLVENAMRQAVTELDPALEIDDATMAAHRGGAKIDLFRAVVPDRADEALSVFTAGLRRAVSDGAVSEVPGATSAFERLRSAGCAVALTTGFDRLLADDLVDHLGWNLLVDATVGGDEVARGRPAPDLALEAARRVGVDDPNCLAVCGDTVNDANAGIAAGAGVVIAVRTGDRPPRAADLPAGVHLLASVADVPELLGI